MRIHRTLTKDYILSNVDEIDIFSEYLNVDDRDIEICIRDNILMCSPLRLDDNPTVGFRYSSKGRLRMRDFSGHFWGDCFDVVAFIYGLNVNNKEHFYQILYDIAIRFDLISDPFYKKTSIATTKRRRKEIRENHKNIIEIGIRKWDRKDLFYWEKIFKNSRLTEKYLEHFRVYPIQNYWINKESNPEPKYFYKHNDPCYAYYFGKDEKGIDDFQLYFPLRKRKYRLPRFIVNSSILRGLDYLPNKMEYLIVTKSYKDFMSLYSFVIPINPNIGILSLASESTPITKMEYDALSSRITKVIKGTNDKAIFTLLDFDLAGVHMSNKLRKDFNTVPFFLTNGKFRTVDYEGKDFTDVLVAKNKDYAETLLQTTMVEINNLIK